MTWILLRSVHQIIRIQYKTFKFFQLLRGHIPPQTPPVLASARYKLTHHRETSSIPPPPPTARAGHTPGFPVQRITNVLTRQLIRPWEKQTGEESNLSRVSQASALRVSCLQPKYPQYTTPHDTPGHFPALLALAVFTSFHVISSRVSKLAGLASYFA